uniref:Uncharacterized protein n=1 Tax=Aegilops tauschii subsp. strangulata TaxID=200361 RepID=A0A453SG74_AEGTS
MFNCRQSLNVVIQSEMFLRIQKNKIEAVIIGLFQYLRQHNC